jgi:hypothetical protein
MLVIMSIWMTYSLVLPDFIRQPKSVSISPEIGDIGSPPTDVKRYTSMTAAVAVTVNVLAALVAYYSCIRFPNEHPGWGVIEANSAIVAYIFWAESSLRIGWALYQVGKPVKTISSDKGMALFYWYTVFAAIVQIPYFTDSLH